MVDPTRVRILNREPPSLAGQYVLYWMQASQRAEHNDALEYAISIANERQQPLVTCFGLMDDYPEANQRHYAFFLHGFPELHADLAERGIRFVVRHGPPPDAALHFGRQASIIVCDQGYTRHQRAWRDKVAREAGRQVIGVEADVVIPVETLSNKQEFAARTIRPKVHRLWRHYLRRLPKAKLARPSVQMQLDGDLDPRSPERLLASLKLDRTCSIVPGMKGGRSEALSHLKQFVDRKLSGYDEGRNEPAAAGTSQMSRFLHFGMISPVEIALAVLEKAGSRFDALEGPADDSQDPAGPTVPTERTAKASSKSSGPPARGDIDAYLEELIVRRELSINYCYYSTAYDRYEGLPEWARKTLAEHAGDRRPVVYSREQLEAGETGDVYWNAAQLQMVRSGFMHNYMRMYWGKKILEWRPTPQEAYADALYLNNRYFLDGRDPNGFVGVGWIFGLHDRPWTERPIFGKVRYMNAAGLERKFDMDAYVRQVAML